MIPLLGFWEMRKAIGNLIKCQLSLGIFAGKLVSIIEQIMLGHLNRRRDSLEKSHFYVNFESNWN